MSSQLNTNVTGILGSYLDSPPQSARLAKRVDATLTMIELIQAMNLPAGQTTKEISATRKREGIPNDDQLAYKIGTLAALAGMGQIQKMNALLYDPVIQSFDLSNRAHASDLPRYVAFEKAMELAVIKNQPEVLQFLLKHPLFKTLTNGSTNRIRLTPWERRNWTHPSALRSIQRNWVNSQKREARNQLLKEAALRAAELGRDDCLRTLYHFDRENGTLQSYFGYLFQAAQKAGQTSCASLILDNVDTSERD